MGLKYHQREPGARRIDVAGRKSGLNAAAIVKLEARELVMRATGADGRRGHTHRCRPSRTGGAYFFAHVAAHDAARALSFALHEDARMRATPRASSRDEDKPDARPRHFLSALHARRERRG